MQCPRCGARYREDPSCGKVIHLELPSREDAPTAYDIAGQIAEVADLHCNPVDVPVEEQDDSDIVLSTDPEGGAEEAVFEVEDRTGQRWLVKVTRVP